MSGAAVCRYESLAMTFFRKSKKGALVPGRMRLIGLPRLNIHNMDACGKVIILEKGLQLRVKLQPKSYDAVSNAALLASPYAGETGNLLLYQFSPTKFRWGQYKKGKLFSYYLSPSNCIFRIGIFDKL